MNARNRTTTGIADLEIRTDGWPLAERQDGASDFVPDDERAE